MENQAISLVIQIPQEALPAVQEFLDAYEEDDNFRNIKIRTAVEPADTSAGRLNSQGNFVELANLGLLIINTTGELLDDVAVAVVTKLLVDVLKDILVEKKLDSLPVETEGKEPLEIPTKDMEGRAVIEERLRKYFGAR